MRLLHAFLAMVIISITALTGTSSTGERTFVYVSNSESGSISVFGMNPITGELNNVGEVESGKATMPLAVSPDRRFLYASIRSQPYSVASYAIDSSTGELDLLSIVPLPESMAYISTDWTGRFLFGASFGSDLISVNPIGRNGLAQAEPVSLIRGGRHAHAIMPDPSNRFVYATNLANDQILQMRFDQETGALTLNKPAAATSRPDAGPRHFCFTPNNRFVYVLNELNGTVTCYALDNGTGMLIEKHSVSAIAPGVDIVPGFIRPPLSASGEVIPEKNSDKPKIWAADIHITPNGKSVYASERTTSTIACFIADPLTGKLVYMRSVETEKQPRGFNIDSKGKFLIAAGEKTDHVSVYAIDQNNGELKFLNRYPTGKNPNWVECVSFW
jgi:6-phosphogluconolactonase